MTLKDFFDLIGQNPIWLLVYFLMIPITALLAGIFGKGEGHLTPWRQLYSTLIYLVAVPGLFAISLSIYFFLFERRSILDTDVFNQIVPVLSMIATLLLIRRNVNMDKIPGFGKISGLMMMIGTALLLMWMVDRTRIWVVSYLPFHQVLLIFAGLLLIIRMGWRKMFVK